MAADPADAWIHGYFSDTALTGIWDTGYSRCRVFGILDTTVLRYPDFGYCIRILYRSGAGRARLRDGARTGDARTAEVPEGPQSAAQALEGLS